MVDFYIQNKICIQLLSVFYRDITKEIIPLKTRTENIIYLDFLLELEMVYTE